MPPRLAGYGWLVVTAFCWGLNWPVLKLLMLEWPVWAYRVFAGGGAVLLLGTLAVLQGQSLRPRPGQFPRLVGAAILNVSSWTLVAPAALLWLDASEAAIIAYTMPVWATMIAWPVLGERPTWRRLAGLALGLSGIVLLMAGQLASRPAADVLAKLPGVAFMLTTAVMFAGGTVFTKRFPIALPPLPLVAWQLLIGLVPVSIVTLSFEHLDLSRIGWLGWGCLAYGIIAAQCGAYLAWFRALRYLPAGTAALGSLLVPIIGVFGSGLVLGEPLGARHLAALALTLSGVVLAARG